MTRRPLTAALIGGIASATGFAPLGLWPVTVIAVAVLMHLVVGAPGWRSAFMRGWWFGFGQFCLGLNWIAHAFDFQDAMPHWFGYGAVLLLSLYLAVYPALAAAGARWFASPRRRPGPLAAESPPIAAAPASAGATFVVAFAALWVVSEYLRATMFTGFPWNPLGVAALGTPLARSATFVGTYGLGAMVVLVAGALLALRTPRTAAALLALPLALTLFAYPWSHAPRAVREIGPAIRIVQPNTSQAERHDRDTDELSVQRLEALTGPPTATSRLILWPEAAAPFFLDQEQWAVDRLSRLLGPRDLLLTGATALVYDRSGELTAARNSLFVVTPDARLPQRYDKAHLVPYGEYLPMRPLLSAIGLSRLVPGDLDFIPGPGPASLDLRGFGKAGVQICYEIVFSGQVVDAANRPDFIFNPSTDAWFGRWGPPQHLAQARLRAIEEGLPVLRATPTGISAVIDADGRLLAALPLNKPGFIATRLPAPHAPTLFARSGNSAPLALALVLAILGVALRIRHR